MTIFKKPYHLRRLSGSITEPLNLTETKLHLRVEHSDDDALISELIIAARQVGEYSAGVAFTAAPFEARYEEYLPYPLSLPMRPVASIASIVTENSEGQSTIIPVTDYHLSSDYMLYTHRAIAEAHITVRFMTSAEIGQYAEIKRALLAHIALMYEQRNGDIAVPQQALSVYQHYREVRV
jgi:uncharacterized phiE125 gp8 family phage protein